MEFEEAARIQFAVSGCLRYYPSRTISKDTSNRFFILMYLKKNAIRYQIIFNSIQE